MIFSDILGLVDSTIESEECKAHFACSNGIENPLDVFLAGNFEEWQAEQSGNNFKRKYIVALIQLPEKSRWLFAGVYRVLGCSETNGPKGDYLYSTEEVESFNEYAGRIVVNYEKSFRHAYPYFEKVELDLCVREIKPEKVAVVDFPGFNSVLISHQVLRSLVLTRVESWRSILSNVKGVYGIIDRTNGKIYVGSATGEDMIWQRWSDYACTGHGGNKELKALIATNGEEYAMNYQYTVLEIADSHASDDYVRERESHWKQVLCTREHGYNAN